MISAFNNYKIIAVLLALLALFGVGFYSGSQSRQDEIDEGITALITCQAGVELQNSAIRRLQDEGDAQSYRIAKAQAEAAKLRQRPLVQRAPPPSDCAGAMAWGKVRAAELGAWK